jgi:cyclohexadienyl dehydratase
MPSFCGVVSLLLVALSGCSASLPRGDKASSSQVSPAASAAPSAPASPTALLNPSAATPVQPAARPVLRVGTSGDYAPFSTLTGEERTGFDIEVARAFASDEGFELQWLPFTWPQLAEQMQSEAIDVAMSGVTWQPSRAVTGYFTRAVAHGGPCILGDPKAKRVAVNHGGVLERWARGHFSPNALQFVDDNRSLPQLLNTGQVGAIVTDSFELPVFRRAGPQGVGQQGPAQGEHCEAELWQKAYWVSKSRALDLGPRLDAWLGAHTELLQAQQLRWFGAAQELSGEGQLVDLLARRFAFMPAVAAFKRKRGLPLEDREREAKVLDATLEQGRAAGLPEAPLRRAFTLLFTLSKNVQQRATEESDLDLVAQVRPALSELGRQLVAAIAHARATGGLARLSATEGTALGSWLTPDELAQLLAALRQVAE